MAKNHKKDLLDNVLHAQPFFNDFGEPVILLASTHFEAANRKIVRAFRSAGVFYQIPYVENDCWEIPHRTFSEIARTLNNATSMKFCIACMRRESACRWWDKFVDDEEDLYEPRMWSEMKRRSRKAGAYGFEAFGGFVKDFWDNLDPRVKAAGEQWFKEFYRQHVGAVGIHRSMTPDMACKILEISWPCTEQQVHESFRTMAQRHHPDHGGTNEKMAQLIEARRYLLSVLTVRIS